MDTNIKINRFFLSQLVKFIRLVHVKFLLRDFKRCKRIPRLNVEFNKKAREG